MSLNNSLRSSPGRNLDYSGLGENINTDGMDPLTRDIILSQEFQAIADKMLKEELLSYVSQNVEATLRAKANRYVDEFVRDNLKQVIQGLALRNILPGTEPCTCSESKRGVPAGSGTMNRTFMSSLNESQAGASALNNTIRTNMSPKNACQGGSPMSNTNGTNMSPNASQGARAMNNTNRTNASLNSSQSGANPMNNTNRTNMSPNASQGARAPNNSNRTNASLNSNISDVSAMNMNNDSSNSSQAVACVYGNPGLEQSLTKLRALEQTPVSKYNTPSFNSSASTPPSYSSPNNSGAANLPFNKY